MTGRVHFRAYHGASRSFPVACGAYGAIDTTRRTSSVTCKNCKRSVAYRRAAADRYTLTLTGEQARSVLMALDLYERAVGLGQTEALAERLVFRERVEPEMADRIRELLSWVKQIAFGHPPNGSYGIRSPEVPREAKLMYDMTQIMRRVFAEERIAAARRRGDYDLAGRIEMSVNMDRYFPTTEAPPITFENDNDGDDR